MGKTTITTKTIAGLAFSALAMTTSFQVRADEKPVDTQGQKLEHHTQHHHKHHHHYHRHHRHHHHQTRVANSITDAIASGETDIDLRLRDEYIHNTSFKQGNAVTLRSMLGYGTAEYNHVSARLDLNAVTSFHDDRYNTGFGTTPNTTAFAPTYDPRGGDIVQGYVEFSALPETTVTVGRQFINLDNERFVGNYDFRQNPQSFDAIAISNWTLPHVHFFYAYVDQFNTISHNNFLSNDRQHNENTHLINLSWHSPRLGTLVGYGYLVEDRDVSFNSGNTFGIRYLGGHQVHNVAIDYAVEYANQRSQHNYPIEYNADYFNAELGFDVHPFFARFGYEVLSGDKNVAGKQFRTPFASSHDFLGWAEAFTSTPNMGVKDLNVTVGADMMHGYTGVVSYHHFNGEDTSLNLGKEWDFGVRKMFSEHYYASAEYATFNGSTASAYPNIERVWVTGGVVF